VALLEGPHPNWRPATVSTGVPLLGFVSSAGDYGESETGNYSVERAERSSRRFPSRLERRAGAIRMRRSKRNDRV